MASAAPWERNRLYTHHRLVKVIGGNRKTELIKDERHERAIAHVARYLVCDIDIFQPRNVENRSESRDSVQPAACCTKEVVEDPVVASIAIDETTGHYRPDFKPCAQWCSDGGTQEDDILYDSERALFRELTESVEDHPGA